MVSVREKKESPRRENGGRSQQQRRLAGTASLPAGADFLEASTTRHRLLADGRPVFTVRVTYRPSAARRSSVFFTPEAAKRYATTMTELGHDAEVTLCALTPLATLLGGGEQ